MYAFQYWLVKTLVGIQLVRPFMTSRWGWPICESLHFLGLSLLVGTIGAFDLRLLGLAKRIPISALHRLIPWGVGGYILNVTTGLMFLVTAPDQYIFNPSFHFKLLFMTIAGLNVLTFYGAFFRRLKTLGPDADAPAPAKWIGGASLFLWTGVILFGRLLTFYRPSHCLTDEAAVFLWTCFK
jgi:hypothetical protein